MRILRTAVTPFRLPFRRTLVLSGMPVAARQGFLVELHDADGQVGIGEASPHPAAQADDLAAAARALGEARKSLVDAGNADAETLLSELASVDCGAARAGLEMAVYDLAGKLSGRRVADLLGPVRRERISINAMLDHTDPDAAAAAASEAVLDGFSCLKLKLLPHDVEAAVAQVAAVRAAVGPAVRLRVDANGAWMAAEAVDAIRQLAVYGLEYAEQPVAELADMAVVRRAVDIPIAADECVTDAPAVRRIADMGAADVVVVKPALLGLVTAAAVVRAACECGLEVVVTSALDTSVGIAAALHLAAILPDPIRPCGLGTASLLAADIAGQPLVAAEGHLAVPVGNGLGVDLDRVALHAHQFEWSSATMASSSSEA